MELRFKNMRTIGRQLFNLFSVLFCFNVLYSMNAMACTQSRDAGASSASIFKSAKNYVFAEVVGTVEVRDNAGEGTQISKLKVIKDYLEKSPQFLNVRTNTYSKQSGDFETRRCGLSYRFQVGEKVLYSPNVSIPATFVSVKDVVQVDKKVDELRLASKSSSVRSISLFLSYEDIVPLNINLDKTLKACENGLKCEADVITKILSFDDYGKVFGDASLISAQTAYRFLNLPIVYKIAEERGLEDKLLYLGLAIYRQPFNVNSKSGKKADSVFSKNIWRIYNSMGYSLIVDGKPVENRSLKENLDK